MLEACTICRSPFDNPIACKRLVDVRRVRFDFRKTYCRLVEVRRTDFDNRKARRRLVEVQRVRFYDRKACTRLVDVLRVGFHNRKACRRLVHVRTVRFDFAEMKTNYNCIRTSACFLNALRKSKRTIPISANLCKPAEVKTDNPNLFKPHTRIPVVQTDSIQTSTCQEGSQNGIRYFHKVWCPSRELTVLITVHAQ